MTDGTDFGKIKDQLANKIKEITSAINGSQMNGINLLKTDGGNAARTSRRSPRWTAPMVLRVPRRTTITVTNAVLNTQPTIVGDGTGALEGAVDHCRGFATAADRP